MHQSDLEYHKDSKHETDSKYETLFEIDIVDNPAPDSSSSAAVKDQQTPKIPEIRLIGKKSAPKKIDLKYNPMGSEAVNSKNESFKEKKLEYSIEDEISQFEKCKSVAVDMDWLNAQSSLRWHVKPPKQIIHVRNCRIYRLEERLFPRSGRTGLQTVYNEDSPKMTHNRYRKRKRLNQKKYSAFKKKKI